MSEVVDQQEESAAQETAQDNVVEMPAPQTEAGAEPTKVESPKPVALPVCGHCGADPATISVMPQAFPGGLIGTIVFCGNPECRKIHTVQILGQAQKTPGGIIVPPGIKT